MKYVTPLYSNSKAVCKVLHPKVVKKDILFCRLTMTGTDCYDS